MLDVLTIEAAKLKVTQPSRLQPPLNVDAIVVNKCCHLQERVGMCAAKAVHPQLSFLSHTQLVSDFFLLPRSPYNSKDQNRYLFDLLIFFRIQSRTLYSVGKIILCIFRFFKTHL